MSRPLQPRAAAVTAALAASLEACQLLTDLPHRVVDRHNTAEPRRPGLGGGCKRCCAVTLGSIIASDAAGAPVFVVVVALSGRATWAAE